MGDEYDIDPCIVCTIETSAKTFRVSFDGFHQLCPRCGEFKLTGSASAMLSTDLGKVNRSKLSGWIRAQNRSRTIPVISGNTINEILNRPIPSVADRAFNILVEAAQAQKQLGERFNMNDTKFMAASYSSDKKDVTFLLKVLKTWGYVEIVASGGECEISPQGYIEMDRLYGSDSFSNQGFIAMWFSQDMDSAYADGFEQGVLSAGYDPIRVDRVEHINRIDDEIIRQINVSKFLVADFTGHRSGVYFEAGYALGKGIPVFWTCRKSDMDELHFDIRQFNCIDWETADDLSKRLANRLEAVLGKGIKDRLYT